LFKVKTSGPWKQLIHLLGGYDRRVQYVRRRISRDLAEAFLERLKETAPTDDEFVQYLKTLKVVELIGTKDVNVFAVVSDRTKIKLGEAREGLESKTVVYFHPSQGEMTSDVVALLSHGNPWPLSMVPHGVPKNDVSIVHRIVTEDEVAWAKRNVLNLISRNRHIFRRYGISWGTVIDEETSADQLESMPDFMSLAIRAEFGINMESKAHWKPAAKWVHANVIRVIEKDDTIRKALHDDLFRDHTFAKDADNDKMKVKDFMAEAGEFQKRVGG